MAILLSGTTNDITINGVSVATDAEVSSVVAPLATTAYVDGKMVLGTAVNSTSVTAIDFTGIPSWVKRITVMFNGVSTNGSSLVQIQLGDSGGIENTGYTCNASGLTTVLGTTSYTTGFGISDNNLANSAHSGSFIINNLTGNIFTFSGITDFYPSAGGAKTSISAGTKTLSGTLDRIRITTVNGTDTFDSGQINIMYEG